MKKYLIILIMLVTCVNFIGAQDIVKCKKQENLATYKAKYVRTYGKDMVDAALNGEIKEGMPEALFLKAFNTEAVEYQAEGCKAYNVYNDDILKPRSPNQMKPSPVYFVITSGNKIVKIKPGDGDSRYKIRNGAIVY